MSRDDPPPGSAPTGVRVRLDGDTYLIDDTLVLRGVDDDGTHQWWAYGPPEVTFDRPVHVTVEALPAKSALHIPHVQVEGLALMAFAARDDERDGR